MVKLKTTCFATMFFFLFLHLISADTLSVKDSAKTVLTLGLTPLYDAPVPGGFPLSYLEPTDTCTIDSSRFDTLNTEWAFVRSVSRSGWLQKSSVRPAYQPDGPASNASSKEKKMDADARRRQRIVSEHPEWERRIARVIREGKICLDMTNAQIEASWGEPVQKSGAFILGAGKQEIWYYKGSGGKIETVFMVKGRVVGWTE